jgi:hypothetical protein
MAHMRTAAFLAANKCRYYMDRKINIHIRIINELGFTTTSMIETTGRLSIADIFTKTKKRCGIYCFKKANETFYIGQAVDVVRRFAQHCKIHDNIICIWFQSVLKKDLDAFEKDLIFKAEKAGLPIVNKSLVSNIIGETDFDLLIDEQLQEKWLSFQNDSSFDEDRVNPSETYRIRYRESYQKLKRYEIYVQLKQLLKLYIKNCIPFPRKTEMSFWEVTCLPSTNASHHPRYFAVNINFMEVFVVGYRAKTKEFWAFINTSKETFIANDKIDDVLLEHEYSNTEFSDEAHYKAAGHDQMRIHFSSMEELMFFLTEPRFIKSARIFNIRLMRKGGTIYSKFHCFDLVDDVLAE